MGTRSLVEFIDTNGKPLTTIYRQYDGYPEARGQELADFLKGKTMVNGIPVGRGKESDYSNGVGDLAAQWIAHEKADHETGGVYVCAAGARDCWEEFLYVVRADEKTGIHLQAFASGEMEPFFSGRPEEFNGEQLQDDMREAAVSSANGDPNAR
jgi:hypothetical protein